MAKDLVIPAAVIEGSILLIRGQTVILDSDLAKLYGVATRALVQAVKAQHSALSGRLHVSIDAGGGRDFEITNRDLKEGARRTALFPLRLFRARRGHAIQRTQQRPGHRRGHRDHAGVRGKMETLYASSS